MISCKLRGIYARETDLLAFIKRSGVRDLSLEFATLVSGTFRPIFDYCTSEASPITKLYFEALFEWTAQSPMVEFLGPGRGEETLEHDAVGPLSSLPSVLSGQPNDGVGPLGQSLSLAGENVKQAVAYHTPDLPPMDSPFLRQWRAFRQREYGDTR